ncbi:hypothetical protein M758_12G166700, partial [Ceratodon purpureus]
DSSPPRSSPLQPPLHCTALHYSATAPPLTCRLLFHTNTFHHPPSTLHPPSHVTYHVMHSVPFPGCHFLTCVFFFKFQMGACFFYFFLSSFFFVCLVRVVWIPALPLAMRRVCYWGSVFEVCFFLIGFSIWGS